MPNYNFAFSPTTIGSVMSFSLFLFIFFITSSRLIYPFSFPLFTYLPSTQSKRDNWAEYERPNYYRLVYPLSVSYYLRFCHQRFRESNQRGFSPSKKGPTSDIYDYFFNCLDYHCSQTFFSFWSMSKQECNGMKEYKFQL